MGAHKCFHGTETGPASGGVSDLDPAAAVAEYEENSAALETSSGAEYYYYNLETGEIFGVKLTEMASGMWGLSPCT